MADIAYLQPWAWIIVSVATGEPALDEFFDDQEGAEGVAAMLRMTMDDELEVRRALL